MAAEINETATAAQLSLTVTSAFEAGPTVLRVDGLSSSLPPLTKKGEGGGKGEEAGV